MVPQDQHVAVASPGIIREGLVLDSIAINAFYREPFLHGLVRCQNSGVVVERNLAGVGARATHHQPENEVPQPHDFVEFGFTNTKPCCMSVSW